MTRLLAVPRRLTLTALAAGMTATALLSPASAAPSATVCARFNDDQRGVIEENFGERHRDMLAGRLRSDRTHLSAVMIVGLVRTEPQPDDNLLNYNFSFDVGALRVFLSAPRDPAARPSYGVVVAGRPIVLGEPELVRDAKNREYRLRVPLTAFAPLVDLSPGAKATGLTASVLLEPGVPAAPPAARAPIVVLDLADGREATYVFSEGPCRMRGKGR